MLKVDISCHDMYCVKVINPSKELRVFLRWAITDNLSSSDYYIKRRLANPFLQSDHEDYILIEFWSDDLSKITECVDWLNEKFSQQV